MEGGPVSGGGSACVSVPPLPATRAEEAYALPIRITRPVDNAASDDMDKEGNVEVGTSPSVNKQAGTYGKPAWWNLLSKRPCKGDGNCMFRAFSDQLYGKQSYHLYIRRMTVELMRLRRSDFACFVDDVDDPEADFDRYLEKIAREGEWSDDRELRAVSMLYDLPIEIYDADLNLRRTFYDDDSRMSRTPSCKTATAKFRIVWDNDPGHYSSVFKLFDQFPVATSTPGTLEMEGIQRQLETFGALCGTEGGLDEREPVSFSQELHKNVVYRIMLEQQASKPSDSATAAHRRTDCTPSSHDAGASPNDTGYCVATLSPCALPPPHIPISSRPTLQSPPLPSVRCWTVNPTSSESSAEHVKGLKIPPPASPGNLAQPPTPATSFPGPAGGTTASYSPFNEVKMPSNSAAFASSLPVGAQRCAISPSCFYYQQPEPLSPRCSAVAFQKTTSASCGLAVSAPPSSLQPYTFQPYALLESQQPRHHSATITLFPPHPLPRTQLQSHDNPQLPSSRGCATGQFTPQHCVAGPSVSYPLSWPVINSTSCFVPPPPLAYPEPPRPLLTTTVASGRQHGVLPATPTGSCGIGTPVRAPLTPPEVVLRGHVLRQATRKLSPAATACYYSESSNSTSNVPVGAVQQYNDPTLLGAEQCLPVVAPPGALPHPSQCVVSTSFAPTVTTSVLGIPQHLNAVGGVSPVQPVAEEPPRRIKIYDKAEANSGSAAQGTATGFSIGDYKRIPSWRK